MSSIRQLVIPNRLIGLKSGISCTSYIPVRNIYLHKGSRVAGLKRDPKEAFTTYNGYQYELSESNLKPIKEFLTQKYHISDELILQVLTHKSFGNGIKPYNEKLSAMGSKILSLFFTKFVVNKPSNNELAINGKNLDVLGSPMAKELGGRYALGVFAKNHNLNSIMFWKSSSHTVGFLNSGELKVSAQMMYALIGAVTLSHGKLVAEEFIQEKILNSNDTPLEDIASTVVESNIERKRKQKETV
ncbi:ribonuclease-III-like-domain-containing protein [Scheffersomyces coipomensis]|uniref:ribonuclease-III-like-domain-containing protein n=1 Tax=Scheffersomyces coipomensis TaxID=1788519 RepID=UPI00315DD537